MRYEGIWSKVDRCGPTPKERPDLGPCWIWTGARHRAGYGQIRRFHKLWLAHVYMYVHLVRSFRSDLELDHLCRVRLCCNPDHLEPVTHRVNCRRGSAGNHNRVKTHCPQGHPYSKENTYELRGGRRQCKTCTRAKAIMRYNNLKVNQ